MGTEAALAHKEAWSGTVRGESRWSLCWLRSDNDKERRRQSNYGVLRTSGQNRKASEEGAVVILRIGLGSVRRGRERRAAARGGREESTGLPRAGDAQQRSRVCAVRRSVVGGSGGGEGCVGAERGGELMRVGRVSCQRSLAPLRPGVEARRGAKRR